MFVLKEQVDREKMMREGTRQIKESLARLVSGLLHRCREQVYICLSELGESGFEQRGELLRAIQKVLTTNSGE